MPPEPAQSDQNPKVTRVRRSDQRGVSLIIALVVMMLIGVSVLALLSFATTATKAAGVNVSNQDLRFAGDNSLRTAVNYVANKPLLGLDQAYFPALADDCRLDVPAAATGVSPISVSCEAIPDTESGIPAEVGKVPEHAVLLLGHRYGDLPVYSPCTATNLTPKGFFQTADSYRYTERSRPQAAEIGLRVDSSSLLIAADNTASCKHQKGAVKSLVVAGDIVSNGPIAVRSGDLPGGITVTDGAVAAGTSPFGSLTGAVVPCTPQITGCSALATARSRSNPGGPDKSPYNPGEVFATDPALDGTTGSEWRQGTVNWSAPKVSINGNAPVLLTSSTPLAGCTASPNVIRFYPGLYKSARALNRIFNDPACAKGADSKSPGIYWFGPAENGDVDYSPTQFSLDFLSANSTAQQGVYAFDFRDTTASYPDQAAVDAELPCGTLRNSNNLHRWCANASLEGIAPSIIGGWPKDWDLRSIIDPPSPYDPNAGLFEAKTATTLDEDGSFSWDTPTGALTFGDAAWARYHPTAVFSTNRSIILSGYPGATAVQADGELSFTVRHKESNSRFLDAPRMTISTTERGSAVETCGGTFVVDKSPDFPPSNTTDGWVEHVVSTEAARSSISLTPAQRGMLRECFKTAERIQNIRIKWEVNGDGTNQGSCGLTWKIWEYLACIVSASTKPQVFLDGIKITAEIPKPITFGADAPPGVSYCDDDRAGVQFIFGGDSTIHLGRASFQICAGPAPSSPANFQQIAVWGQPANFVTAKSGSVQTEIRVGKTGTHSLKPTGVAVAARTANRTCAWYDIPCHVENIVLAQPSWNSGTVQRALSPGDPYTAPGSPLTRVAASFDTGNAWFSYGDAELTGWGKVGALGGACNAANDLCKHSEQMVSSVLLKVGYDTDCDAWFGPFCNLSGAAGKLHYQITGFAGDTNPACSGSFDPVSNLVWFSANVTQCFGADNARAANLSSSTLKVKLTFDCNFCFSFFGLFRKEKLLEGAEFVVAFSTPEASNIISPATGCKTGLMGYGSGVGDYGPMMGNYVDENARNAGYLSDVWGTDCALISGAPPTLNLATSNPSYNPLDEVYGTARTSVLGTVYAPSDALEISDGDNFYSFASRGLVARHLRVRAVEGRNGYSEPLVTNQIDQTPNSRSVIMTACRKATGRSVSEECDKGQGDVIIAEAAVRFDPPPSGSTAAWTPTVLWWNTNEI